MTIAAHETQLTKPNMWAVAWRQHRWQIAAIGSIMAVIAVAQLVYRISLVRIWTDHGCVLITGSWNNFCADENGGDLWWNTGLHLTHDVLESTMLVGPLVIGALAAAPLVTREFTHGTHVFALTQSVRRGRWFATKVMVVLLPLVAGLLVLGFLTEWVDGTIDATAYRALENAVLLRQSILPAAVGTLGFATTLAVGMLTRNLLAALVVGVVAGGVLVVGSAVVEPYLLPAQRESTAITTIWPQMTQKELDAQMQDDGQLPPIDPDEDMNLLWVRGGFLDENRAVVSLDDRDRAACADAGWSAGEAAARAAGLVEESEIEEDSDPNAPVMVSNDDYYYNTAIFQNAQNTAMVDCFADRGVAYEYYDYLPGSSLWPMRGVMALLLLLLAAGFVAIAVIRLPKAVARR